MVFCIISFTKFYFTIGVIYCIIDTKETSKGTKRGKTIKGDWITIESKFVDIVGD